MVERFLIAGRAVWFYLGRLLWPGNLIFIYPRWHVSQTVWWQYLFPAMALVAAVALWTLRGRSRAPLAAMLFFVGTLFPVLGFFNVYPFIFSFVADHFQYLANFGVIALTAAGLAMLLGRLGLWGRPTGYALCLGLLAVLGSLSFRQSSMYTNIEQLYRTTIAKNPTCSMAYNNLGNVLNNHGRSNEAMEMYRKAIAIKPDHAAAYFNLASLLVRRGEPNEAIHGFEKAL